MEVSDKRSPTQEIEKQGQLTMVVPVTMKDQLTKKCQALGVLRLDYVRDLMKRISTTYTVVDLNRTTSC